METTIMNLNELHKDVKASLDSNPKFVKPDGSYVFDRLCYYKLKFQPNIMEADRLAEIVRLKERGKEIISHELRVDIVLAMNEDVPAKGNKLYSYPILMKFSNEDKAKFSFKPIDAFTSSKCFITVPSDKKDDFINFVSDIIYNCIRKIIFTLLMN